ncbi:MAG: metal-dependent hydrolase, partial [Spirochaetota bacterium]
MTAATHYAFSYLVCTAVGIPPGTALAASVVSLLPDIDHPESIVGRIVPSISKKIMQRYGHRTVTHSIFAVCTISVFFLPLIFLTPFFKGGAGVGSTGAGFWSPSGVEVYFSIVLAYSSHIFIDLFNRAGVKLLAPISQKEYISFHTPALRITVRSWQEYLFLFLIVFLSFTITGETFSIHKGIRTASKLIYRHYDGALTDYENSSKNICT